MSQRQENINGLIQGFEDLEIWNDLTRLVNGPLAVALEAAGPEPQNYEISSGLRKRLYDFVQKWDIPDRAVDNFLHLAHGSSTFPVIMLLNPTNNHGTEIPREMVKKSPTLFWIKSLLAKMHLQFEDVCILDICPLLSDNDIIRLDRRYGQPEAVRAVAQATDLCVAVLNEIRPEVVVVCQASTKRYTGPQARYNTRANANKQLVLDAMYDGCNTRLREAFTSSVAGANNREVLSVRLEAHGRTISAVQAFHPRYFLLKLPRPEGRKIQLTLEDIFKTVYEPCVAWRDRQAQRTYTSVPAPRSATASDPVPVPAASTALATHRLSASTNPGNSTSSSALASSSNSRSSTAITTPSRSSLSPSASSPPSAVSSSIASRTSSYSSVSNRSRASTPGTPASMLELGAEWRRVRELSPSPMPKDNNKGKERIAEARLRDLD